MLLMQDSFLLCLEFEVLVFVVYHGPCMFLSCDCFPLCVCVCDLIPLPYLKSCYSTFNLIHSTCKALPAFSIEFFNFIFISLEFPSIFLFIEFHFQILDFLHHHFIHLYGCVFLGIILIFMLFEFFELFVSSLKSLNSLMNYL